MTEQPPPEQDALAAVARVRLLHSEYRPAAFDDYDCCAHCNIGGQYVRWPCETIRALTGGESWMRKIYPASDATRTTP